MCVYPRFSGIYYNLTGLFEKQLDKVFAKPESIKNALQMGVRVQQFSCPQTLNVRKVNLQHCLLAPEVQSNESLQ